MMLGSFYLKANIPVKASKLLQFRKGQFISRCKYSNTTSTSGDNLEIKVKTLRPPNSVQQNAARKLRRSFVPQSNRTHYISKDQLAPHLISNFKVRSCTTITTSEKYDLFKVILLLNDQGLQPTNLIPGEIVTFKYTHDGDRGDVMILGQNGSIVSWGFDENTVLENILPLVSSARMNPLDRQKYESEDIDYIELVTEEDVAIIGLPSNIAREESFISEDLLVVNSTNRSLGLLDKAAFSSGISRSTFLAVLESALDEHITQSRVITETFSKGTQINLKEKHFLKSIGRLFLIRGKLNLYSELIETPDLYWSEPQLEKIFKNVSKYLDVTPRINILNSKLDYSTDESRALLAVFNEKKSTFLEWIIIYLIAFEVCFELYHYYEKHSTKPNLVGQTS